MLSHKIGWLKAATDLPPHEWWGLRANDSMNELTTQIERLQERVHETMVRL